MIINESNTKGNKYCVKFKIGDKVRFIHPGGKLSKEIATITGYDKDGFYTYTWSDGEKSNGSSDVNFRKINEDTVKKANGKWTNRGKDGEHGEFSTKSAADAQRKAMFANGYKS